MLSEVIATTARGDTVRDSIATSAVVIAEIRDTGDQVTMTGRVDSVRTRSQRRGGPAYLVANGVPFGFTMQRSTRTRSIARDSISACSAAITAQGIAATMVWRIPTLLRPNTSWADSLSRTTCVGNVVAAIRSEAEYMLLEQPDSVDGTELRQVVRLTRSTMQNRDTILADTSFIVRGSVSATDTLSIDLARGRVVRASGTSRGMIQVTRGTQVEVYDQRATYQLVRAGVARR